VLLTSALRPRLVCIVPRLIVQVVAFTHNMLADEATNHTPWALLTSLHRKRTAEA
jgi:hypothetical protein